MHGNSLEVLPTLAPGTFDAVVTDPPYELGMARWDSTGIAFNVDLWRAVLRVTKPGAHLLAFGASRLYHRLAAAIEDAGWEVRDCLVWAYAGGMPHAQDLAKAIDKEVGGTPLQLDREWLGDAFGTRRTKRLHRITAPGSPQAAPWRGWSTGLRPAWEPIVVARAPLSEPTAARNVLAHGTGGLNTGGNRVGGSWPSNIVATDPVLGRISPLFVVPKAKGARRGGHFHETVKPIDLMAHLLSIVTPPGGHVLDPFGGSGSTGVAARLLGFEATLIELSPEYARQAQERIDLTEPL